MSKFSISELGQALRACFATCSGAGASTRDTVSTAETKLKRQLGVAQFHLQSLHNTISQLEQKKIAAMRSRNLAEAKSCLKQQHLAKKKLTKHDQTCTVIQNMLEEISDAEFTRETVTALSTAHQEFKGLKLEKLYGQMSKLTDGLSEHKSLLNETQTLFSDTTMDLNGNVLDDADLEREFEKLQEQYESMQTGAPGASPLAGASDVSAPVSSDAALPPVPTHAFKPPAAGGVASAYGKIGLVTRSP